MATDLNAISEKLSGIRQLFTTNLEGAREKAKDLGFIPYPTPKDYYWDMLSSAEKSIVSILQDELFKLIKEISKYVKTSSLLTEVDQRDLSHCVKGLRATLHLRKYRYGEVSVISDEDSFVGIHPPWQSDDEELSPREAETEFNNYIERLERMLEIIKASDMSSTEGTLQIESNITQKIRQDTAFIMMSMDPSKPELQDVYDSIKSCFKEYGINAVRADDIEHEDIITKKILDEIRTSEFLFGDLTGERPSVYYEIGYAHALGRRVMLFRLLGTSIHFDLAAYNCPEYKNNRDLKEQLRRRLEHVTNRKPQSNKAE